jgi:hypothetical protein
MNFLKPAHEHRECFNCENIFECPHPKVDLDGNPEHPDYCLKKDTVSLVKPEVDEMRLMYGRVKTEK